MWPTTASPEQASEHWAAFVGTQLARKKAVHAGSPDLTSKVRRFGVVHYDDTAGTFAKSVTHFEQRLSSYKVKAAVTVPYSLDLDDRATGRPQRDRQAQELRRDQRAPRR